MLIAAMVAVSVTVPELPDRVFEGKVARNARALAAGTRTLLTEVDVDNKDGTLTAGLYGIVHRLSLVLRRQLIMTTKFKIGDLVTWNSEAGHVSGKIIKVHTEDVDHHASPDDPQYEIKSDKTDHIAMHKGHALKKTSA